MFSIVMGKVTENKHFIKLILKQERIKILIFQPLRTFFLKVLWTFLIKSAKISCFFWFEIFFFEDAMFLRQQTYKINKRMCTLDHAQFTTKYKQTQRNRTKRDKAREY